MIETLEQGSAHTIAWTLHGHVWETECVVLGSAHGVPGAGRVVDMNGVRTFLASRFVVAVDGMPVAGQAPIARTMAAEPARRRSEPMESSPAITLRSDG